MTYRDLYKFGCLKLQTAEISDYKTDAEILLEYVFGTDRNFLFLNGDKEVSGEKEAEYRSFIEKRAGHVPVQHLTHTQNFMGFDFYVDEHVLVPRFDTEVLVEEALKELHDGFRILDMCTGSGCILLSLLKLSNDCTGVGADLSDEALEISKKNAELLKVDMPGQADFVKSDLFDRVEGKFDMLVSNPPYIKTSDIAGLMPEVKDHDPFMALDGHEDGLFFYERIVKEADDHLKRGSYVFFEIGEDQGKAVSDILREAGYLNIEVIKDLSGLDRVVKAVHR